jgi:hypothetical protein
MILFDGSNRLELKIVAYQFPGQNRDEYDNNWLLVLISVDHPKGSWTSIDACLLTWEAERLAKWLRLLAEGSNVENEKDFIEPNLRFEILNAPNRKLRVYFELECRPTWAPADGAGMDDLWIDFDPKQMDLRAAADSLDEDLKKFPQRGT